jgi:glucan biosynthesis protein C
MLLGLVVHSGSLATVFFAPREALLDQSIVFLAVLVHNFRMPAFFTLAGLFGALLLDKLSQRKFWLQRSKRLALPLLVGQLTIVPLTLASGFDPIVSFEQWVDAGWMHLWFIFYLLIFSAFASAGHLLTKTLKAKLGIESFGATRLFKSLGNPISIFVLALSSCALPAYFNESFGALEKSSSFIPDISLLAFYGCFFTFGYAIYSQWELISAKVTRQWWVYLLIGSISFTNYYWLVETNPENQFLKLLYTNSTWMFSVAIVGLCLRFGNKPTSFAIYFSEASYWIYLVHLPFVMLSLGWLAQFSTNLPIAFLATLVMSFTASVVTYHLFVRKTFIGKFLAGTLTFKSNRNKKVRSRVSAKN